MLRAVGGTEGTGRCWWCGGAGGSWGAGVQGRSTQRRGLSGGWRVVKEEVWLEMPKGGLLSVVIKPEGGLPYGSRAVGQEGCCSNLPPVVCRSRLQLAARRQLPAATGHPFPPSIAESFSSR